LEERAMRIKVTAKDKDCYDDCLDYAKVFEMPILVKNSKRLTMAIEADPDGIGYFVAIGATVKKDEKIADLATPV
jgi:hypothetical protein